MVDKSWMETFQFMTKMINDYDEFLPNTYLQYYLYPEHILAQENPEYTRANEVMDGHEKHTFEMLEKVIEYGKIKGTEFELKNDLTNAHGAYIVELAEAIAENTGRIFLCMTENHGIIPNLTEGMMVEVPCRVTNRGLEPLNVGNIPTFQKGLLENQYAYEKLTVDAYMEHSYQKALQALVLNRMVNDTDKAKKILDEVGVPGANGEWVQAGTASTSIFMYPGYKFNVVDKMFTNFHTPESTLIMLVSAFAGRENILNAYKQAVENRYRFFSYGDCMFIR